MFVQRFCEHVNEAIGLEPQQSSLLSINTDNDTVVLELRGGDPTRLQIAFIAHVDEFGLSVPPFVLLPKETTGAPSSPPSTQLPTTSTTVATTRTQDPEPSVNTDEDDLTDSKLRLLVAGGAVVLVLLVIMVWVTRSGHRASAPAPLPASAAAVAPETGPDSMDVVVKRLMHGTRANPAGAQHVAGWAMMSAVHDEVYGATLTLSNEGFTAGARPGELLAVDVGSFA